MDWQLWYMSRPKWFVRWRTSDGATGEFSILPNRDGSISFGVEQSLNLEYQYELIPPSTSSDEPISHGEGSTQGKMSEPS